MTLPTRWLAPLALAAALLAGDARSQQGEPLPAAVVAVVDYQRVLRESTAMIGLREWIESRRQQDETFRLENQARLREEEVALARQRTVLSPEAFDERRAAFEADVAEVQRQVQERRLALDTAYAEAVATVRETVVDLLRRMADDRGFNIVLPSSGLLLFTPEVDLTEQVLAGLNRELPDAGVP